MKLKHIISTAKENGWNVSSNKLNNECVQFEFSKFTPYGQDFNFASELSNNDPSTLIENIKTYYEDFDPDQEAYHWIGEDGHGRNGAPYHIKDIVNDMEAVEEMIYQFYIALTTE